MTGHLQKSVASTSQELLKMQPPGPGLERKRPFTGDVKPNTQNYQKDRACPVFFCCVLEQAFVDFVLKTRWGSPMNCTLSRHLSINL